MRRKPTENECNENEAVITAAAASASSKLRAIEGFDEFEPQNVEQGMSNVEVLRCADRPQTTVTTTKSHDS